MDKENKNKVLGYKRFYPWAKERAEQTQKKSTEISQQWYENRGQVGNDNGYIQWERE